jgi:hypothetical protein
MGERGFDRRHPIAPGWARIPTTKEPATKNAIIPDQSVAFRYGFFPIDTLQPTEST